jgi:hypothetical protein
MARKFAKIFHKKKRIPRSVLSPDKSPKHKTRPSDTKKNLFLMNLQMLSLLNII